MLKFPEDFFWGAATSAYQVEGNNNNADWWEWEKRAGLKETSGQACRHYQLYKEDFDKARLLGHNAHRLSIEWSRVEPQAGKFREEELAHYREVILYLISSGLEPIVTLHHFTNPLWFNRLGGWLNRKAVSYYLRYTQRIVELLGDKVKFWVTINEPMVYVYHSYIIGAWPPQERSFLKAVAVKNNLIYAHNQAYRLIHNTYKKNNLAHAPLVSIAHNAQYFMSERKIFKDRLAVYLRDRVFNLGFINRLSRNKTLDFIGLNYYTRSLVEAKDYSLRGLFLDTGGESNPALKKNSLGWDIYPEGLYHLLLRLAKYNLPIFILENGISTDDDSLRWDFIYQHLRNIYLALDKGVKVIGWLYWSLLDNFEWDKGFTHRFGLIEVDYNTYERKLRDSAKKLALVCKTGRLEEGG